MTIIQYAEQGIFIDYVDREELADKLQERINVGIQMLNKNDAKEMAQYLGYFQGNHDTMFWRGIINQRVLHLMDRLNKLKAKETGNG